MKRKLAFYWLIVLVTMTTPISSHVKDKNDMFTARGEDMIFLVKGEILVFHQYLHNNTESTVWNPESTDFNGIEDPFRWTRGLESGIHDSGSGSPRAGIWKPGAT